MCVASDCRGQRTAVDYGVFNWPAGSGLPGHRDLGLRDAIQLFELWWAIGLLDLAKYNAAVLEFQEGLSKTEDCGEVLCLSN